MTRSAKSLHPAPPRGKTSATDWSRALALRLAETRALALALFRRHGEGRAEFVDASEGASAAFVVLCRDMAGAPGAWRPQARQVQDVGLLAWSALTTPPLSVAVFALSRGAVDQPALHDVCCLAAKVLAHRLDPAARAQVLTRAGFPPPMLVRPFTSARANGGESKRTPAVREMKGA